MGLFAIAGFTDWVDGFIARRWNLQTVVGSVIDPMADKTLMTILTVTLAMQGLLPGLTSFLGGGGVVRVFFLGNSPADDRETDHGGGVSAVWLAVIILGRDVGLAISAIYFRWISLPPPKTMARYWDFSLPSAEVYPTTISKVRSCKLLFATLLYSTLLYALLTSLSVLQLNTALQLGVVGACMAHPLISGGADWDAALQAAQSVPPRPLPLRRSLTSMRYRYTVATTTVWSGLSYVYSNDAVKILKQPAQHENVEK